MGDLAWSAAVGLAAGGALLFFLQKFPGKPFKYGASDDDSSSERIDPNANDEQVIGKKKEYSVNEVLETMTEEDVIKKTTKLRKVLGIDEEVVRKAVRKTKDEARSGNSPGDDNHIVKIADWVVFLILVAAALYFLDISTNGQVYRVFHGLFPAEFATLKLPRPT
jgi:hypothetical protein